MKTNLFKLCAVADDIEIDGYKIDELFTDRAFGQEHPELAVLCCEDVRYYFEDQEVELVDGLVEVYDFPNPEDSTDEATKYRIEFKVLVPLSEEDLP